MILMEFWTNKNNKYHNWTAILPKVPKNLTMHITVKTTDYKQF